MTVVCICCQSFESVAHQLVEINRRVPIPRVVYHTLWEHCVRLANRTFVEGWVLQEKSHIDHNTIYPAITGTINVFGSTLIFTLYNNSVEYMYVNISPLTFLNESKTLFWSRRSKKVKSYKHLCCLIYMFWWIKNTALLNRFLYFYSTTFM